MVKTLILLSAMSLLGGLSWANAQAMRDPTQPPAGFFADSGQSTVTNEDAGALKPALNTIIRRHGAKPVAVINGEMVRLGGKIGDWVLIRIDESEVVLKGRDGRETLSLLPDVEKRPVKATVGKSLR